MRSTTTAVMLCLLPGLQACAAFPDGMFDEVQYLRDVRVVAVSSGQMGLVYWLGVIVVQDRNGVSYDVHVQPFNVERRGLVPAVGEVCTFAYAWAIREDDFASKPPSTPPAPKDKVREGRSATCGSVTYNLPGFSDD